MKFLVYILALAISGCVSNSNGISQMHGNDITNAKNDKFRQCGGKELSKSNTTIDQFILVGGSGVAKNSLINFLRDSVYDSGNSAGYSNIINTPDDLDSKEFVDLFLDITKKEDPNLNNVLVFVIDSSSKYADICKKINSIVSDYKLDAIKFKVLSITNESNNSMKKKYASVNHWNEKCLRKTTKKTIIAMNL